MTRHVVDDWSYAHHKDGGVLCVEQAFEWPERCYGVVTPAGLIIRSGPDEYLFAGVPRQLLANKIVMVARIQDSQVTEGWEVRIES